MPQKKSLKLRTHDDYHTAYLELADHPHELRTGCVKRTIRVTDLIPNYDGPGIGIDFDELDRAIGIEILYSYEDEDDDESEE